MDTVVRAEITLRDDGVPPQTDLDVLIHALNGGRGDEQYMIARVGLEMLAMLLRKNERYGSSATKPIRVFSKLPPLEGIHLRMDDKLSRVRAGAADDDEDPVFDLAGYCILEIVARRGTP